MFSLQFCVLEKDFLLETLACRLADGKEYYRTANEHEGYCGIQRPADEHLVKGIHNEQFNDGHKRRERKHTTACYIEMSRPHVSYESYNCGYNSGDGKCDRERKGHKPSAVGIKADKEEIATDGRHKRREKDYGIWVGEPAGKDESRVADDKCAYYVR